MIAKGEHVQSIIEFHFKLIPNFNDVGNVFGT